MISIPKNPPVSVFCHTPDGVSLCAVVEKGEPRPAGGGQAQHPSPKDSGGEDEEADAERGVLEKKGGGGALEDGDAVRFGKQSWFKMLSVSRRDQSRVLWVLFPGDMKKTCTGGGWRKISTTGTSGGVYQTEGIRRVLRGFWESGPACLVCSPRVPW